ncbi:hypothetical protein BKA70DRAFT_1554146 [Coprinopsis sp. MPI-PUGE-AT-0042]|nr:hypothetical protein BKA70DRAFT_1554146 [Coprinopsis sp. MPI-PUGE-AT-0042]
MVLSLSFPEMCRSGLLGRLLAIVQTLLDTAAEALAKPWQKILRILAVIGSFLRLRSQITRKPRDDTTTRRSGDCNDNEEKFSVCKGANGGQTHPTTPHDIIPLDSSMTCARHPYPYIHDDKSQSVLSLSSIRAARLVDTNAAASHQTSRSSHSLGYPQLGTETWTVGSPGAAEDEYTFNINSPEEINPPVSRHRSSFRGFSTSCPDLDTSATNRPTMGLDMQTFHTAASPRQSIQTVDQEVGVGEDGDPGVTPQLGHDRIYPLPPDFFSRYEQVKYAEKKETELIIKPMTVDFYSKPHPQGWVPVLHPDGVLYWYNEEKKVVTENDMHDPEFLGQVTENLATFDDFISANRIQLPSNITLAFELTKDDEQITTDYYYADHDKRVIFFLDEFKARYFKTSQDVKGVTSLVHIQHELEAQYWWSASDLEFTSPHAAHRFHIMLYPSTLPQTQAAASELKDFIFHCIADSNSSAFSTSRFDPDELYKLLSVVNAMQKTECYQIGAASFISRTMIVLAQHKFYNWYGVPQRRLYRDQTVHATTNKRTWLIKLLSPLLFYAPDVHLGSLHALSVDGVLDGHAWSKVIKKLNEEWQEFILYATVLLNANVAFLAIQSIDTQEGSYRSPAQLASYLSVVASIGSIIIGLLLVRQNRTRANDYQFLDERSHTTLGLETLAVLYSLPYVLLLFGMVSFVAAFAWHCFDSTNISTRAIMGPAWAMFAALVVWCVWVGWAHHEMEADVIPAGVPTPADAPSSDTDKHKRWKWLKNVANLERRWNWNPVAFWNLGRPLADPNETQV